MTETHIEDPTKILRQSAINEADVCGYRTKLRKETDIPRTTSVMRAAGTAYHGGLAAGYLLKQAGEPLDMDHIVAAAMEELHDELYEVSEKIDWRFQPKTSRLDEVVFNEAQLKQLVVDSLHRYNDNGHWWPDRYEILGVEQYFRLPLPIAEGWTRTGTMDLVLRDTDTGWVHIVDHKMTKKKWAINKTKPSASVQAAWYVDASKVLYGTDDVTFVYDVFDLSGGFNRIPAHRDERHIAATMLRAKIFTEVEEQGGPYQPNTASFLCTEAYCDYWSVCPFGPALNS